MGPDLPKWWWYLRPFCAGARYHSQGSVSSGRDESVQDLLSVPNASFSAAVGEVATVTKTVESISSAGLPSEPLVPQFPGLHN